MGLKLQTALDVLSQQHSGMSEEVKHFLISVVCCSCVLDCIVAIIIIGIIIYSLMNHTLESRMGMSRKGVHNRKQYGTRLH